MAFTNRKDGGGTHIRESRRMINSVFPILSVRSYKHLRVYTWVGNFISGYASLEKDLCSRNKSESGLYLDGT